MDNEDKKKPASTGDEKATGRRKLLKSVVAGGGAVTVAKMLPDQWARPVVDTVMLPSHAETSERSSYGPFLSTGNNVQIETEASAVQMAEQGFSEELLEFFAPVANAGFDGRSVDFSLTANTSGDSYFCANAGGPTEYIPIQIQNGSFTSGQCMFKGQVKIDSGRFDKEQGWLVSVTPYPYVNGTTNVILVEGGIGCNDSYNETGRCLLVNVTTSTSLSEGGSRPS